MDVDDLTKRQDLIAAVEAGRMSPEEAERTALVVGVSPLLPPLRPDDFDPEVQDRWTLLMAVVWVLARNTTAVRNSWNDYIVTQYRWVPLLRLAPAQSHRVQRRDPQWVSQIPRDRLGEYVFRDLPGRSFTASLTRLKHSFANAKVQAWGRDVRRGEDADMQPIPATNWDALQFASYIKPTLLPDSLHSALGRAAEKKDFLHFGDENPVYTDVTVDRVTLMAAFPPLEQPAAQVLLPRESDPVGQVIQQEETPADYKRRVRLRAIRMTFPEGTHKAMGVKPRNIKLDAAVKAIDPEMPLTPEREWRRLWSEVHGKK